MNPLKADDPRHLKALKAADRERFVGDTPTSAIIAAYFASLKRQGVAIIEAYPGDDA